MAPSRGRGRPGTLMFSVRQDRGGRFAPRRCRGNQLTFEDRGDLATMSREMEERLQVLKELGASLAARRADLVAAAGEDLGVPCTIAGLEVDLAVEHLQTMALEVPRVEGKFPYGTVAAIFPYDAAPVMLARVGGAAVLGGNRLLFSCSSQTPLTG